MRTKQQPEKVLEKQASYRETRRHFQITSFSKLVRISCVHQLVTQNAVTQNQQHTNLQLVQCGKHNFSVIESFCRYSVVRITVIYDGVSGFRFLFIQKPPHKFRNYISKTNFCDL